MSDVDPLRNRPSIERVIWTAVWFGGLGPLLAHGLWRPLVEALGADHAGLAVWVAAAGLAVSSLASLLGALRRPLALPASAALALVLGFGVAGGLPAAVALLVVATVTSTIVPRLLPELPPAFDGLARRRPLAALLWVVTALAFVRGGFVLAVFLGDPSLEAFATPPGSSFFARHLCLSAYLHAATLVDQGVTNVYDLALVPTEGLPETAAHMAPFTLDRYGYPPQFLLAPLGLIHAVPSFVAQRALWCGFLGLSSAAALVAFGRWVGPRAGAFLLLAAPLLWSLMVIVHQVGNVQLVVLSVGALAMIAFEHERDALGGALLALATLAKIAPGLLGVLLLVQRRWRAVAWTVAAAVLISALALVFIEWATFEAFIDYHLPRVSSGEAYDFLDDDEREIRSNTAAFSIPFRLAAAGLELDAWALAPWFGHGMTLLAFVMAVIAGFRRGDRRASLAIWLVILTLAGLRSPMAPPYLLAGPMIAMCLVAAELRGAKAWALWILGLAPIILLIPMVPPLPIALTVVVLLAFYVELIWLVLRRWPPLDRDALSSAPT